MASLPDPLPTTRPRKKKIGNEPKNQVNYDQLATY